MADMMATALAQLASKSCKIKIGNVSTTSPLTVSVDGGIVQVSGHLTSYTPAAGNEVVLLSDGDTMIILGRYDRT